jgi:Domain of unknown function (DUF5666)
MPWRKTALTAILIACAAAAVPVAGAQSQPSVHAPSDTPDKPKSRFGNPTSIARIYQDYVYGVVKKIDEKENDIILDKTLYGDDQTFKLQSKTKFIHDGKPGSLKQLKVGDDVYVKVHRDKKTGEMTAQKIVSGVMPTG